MARSIRYKGKQLIISSDRIHFHSKNDCILFYGNKSVEIYTSGDIKMQALENVIIDSVNPKGSIELGYNAKNLGSPVTKADELTSLLKLLLERLADLSAVLKGISYQNLEQSTPQLALSSEMLLTMIQFVLTRLEAGDIKSEKTFTI